jgi:hypothetical protein
MSTLEIILCITILAALAWLLVAAVRDEVRRG